jgi:hypothetical protein
MDIQKQAMLALDILECAELLHEFEDNVTVSIPKDLWDEFCGKEQDNG